MRSFRKPLTVAVAAAALATGVASGVWAQGEWKAPADAKNVKNPLAAKKGDAKLLAGRQRHALTLHPVAQSGVIELDAASLGVVPRGGTRHPVAAFEGTWTTSSHSA